MTDIHRQDDETYTSKIGLTCVQHARLDCHAFIDVGFTAEEVDELISRCPQSCSSSPIPAIEEQQQRSLQNHITQNARATLTLGQINSIGNACPNIGWKDDSCRDDPGFLADALLLPCESFQLLECDKLGAIGLDDQQVHTIVNACPCSCNIPCGTWTMSPTDAPTFAPTVSPAPTTAMPTTRPTAEPSPDPTHQPSPSPTSSPTKWPTMNPTHSPTKQPSRSPTVSPTAIPTKAPTMRPTHSLSPSLAPSISSMPTSTPPGTVWQEHKQAFQGLLVIFGAVAVALLGFGLITLYRKEKNSRNDRDELLQGMGYGPSGGNKAPAHQSRAERLPQKTDKRSKERGSSKGKAKFAEPNVRSNNARVPAAIFEQSISNRQLVDPMDGVVNVEADPHVAWLNSYALRHQPPKPQAIAVPNASDDFATVLTARSSSSTLNTKTTRGTRGTAISKPTLKSNASGISKVTLKSNGTGKGSIVVFQKNDEMKAPPLARNRTAETAPIEEDRSISEKIAYAQPTTMQYVLPSAENKGSRESSEGGKKAGRFFRWPILRKTDAAEDKPREEPFGLIEQPRREMPDPRGDSRQRLNGGALYQMPSVDRMEVARKASVASHQQEHLVGIEKPAWPTWSERGAWLPTAMFGAPGPDIAVENDRHPAVTSAPTSEQQQSSWQAWLPGDMQWFTPKLETVPESERVVDVEKGNIQQAAEPVENRGYCRSLPQVECPAWVATSAAPSGISEARQQSSIMSPTTEDGIGNTFNFTKQVKLPKKWLKNKSTNQSVEPADPNASSQ